MIYDSNYQTDQERIRRQQGMPIQEQPDAMSTNEELLQKAANLIYQRLSNREEWWQSIESAGVAREVAKQILSVARHPEPSAAGPFADVDVDDGLGTLKDYEVQPAAPVPSETDLLERARKYLHDHGLFHAPECLAAEFSAILSEHSATEVIHSWESKQGGPWLDSDPVDVFKMLNEIENRGFEVAHDLRPCGHSRGDFRDAGYVRGKAETYTGSEKCVGCERERQHSAAVESAVATEHKMWQSRESEPSYKEELLAIDSLMPRKPNDLRSVYARVLEAIPGAKGPVSHVMSGSEPPTPRVTYTLVAGNFIPCITRTEIAKPIPGVSPLMPEAPPPSVTELRARLDEHQRSCLYCNQVAAGCDRGRELESALSAAEMP